MLISDVLMDFLAETHQKLTEIDMMRLRNLYNLFI